jgi:hypothetical protein
MAQFSIHYPERLKDVEARGKRFQLNKVSIARNKVFESPLI